MDQIQARKPGATVPTALLVSVAAVLLAQGLVDSLNVGQMLKENYPHYQLVFLPLLATMLAAYLYYETAHHDIRISYVVGVATLAGYLSGFISFYILPLFGTNGLQRFSQPPKSGGEWITLAWSPLVILAWLVGAIASVSVLLVVKKIPGRIVQFSTFAGLLGVVLLARRFSLFGHLIQIIKGPHI